ncbi:MAG: High-affinity zinc uptake system ATP-binding protein ZnuC [Chlamydiae bacterium]|nr:High-affinity zinc uptake system ATP-binding protein ZnuC [Chlamydiota bacterium]
MSKPKAVFVEDLFFSYPQTPVLSEVSFSIYQGEFVAFFGPNGGGKTTLLHLLMGFLPPDHGVVQLLGKKPKEVSKKIGWVPQNFHFDPTFPISVQEVVLGGRLSFAPKVGGFRKEDQEKVRESLKLVNMEHKLSTPFSSLSGGQQQRVLIARALASDPDLLLLDEPTASVDFDAQNAIYDLLCKLRGKLTIIMVTHDLHSAVAFVDRLFCIQKNATEMPAEKVCEHFALGLYHSKESK